MPLIIRNIRAPLDAGEKQLRQQVLPLIGATAAIKALIVLRKSIDARKKPHIIGVYTVRVEVDNEGDLCKTLLPHPEIEQVPLEAPMHFTRVETKEKIVIAGFGPAGMFCALRLAAYGVPCTVLERGKPVSERVKDVGLFWGRGILDCQSNVQFGEGGAGTFSDGKLTCRVKDPNTGWVLEQLVRFGAPEVIRYQAKAHIGTDRLRKVVTRLREHLQEQGCTIRFSSCMSELSITNSMVSSVHLPDGDELTCDRLVLALGHSARDTYHMLLSRGVVLEAKPFAVGLRVEHPQQLINQIQYGTSHHPLLGSAEYALTWNDLASGRSCYSFCMCPGGTVIAGSSEAGMVVTNGMSNHDRNSGIANSALVVSVRPEDFDQKDPLSGVRFQQNLESRAFIAGGGEYHAPVQNMMTFLGGKGGECRSSYRPGTKYCDLQTILPDYVSLGLRQGITAFDRKMRGFKTIEATLTGVETRTSAPVRIPRGESGESVAIGRLYPCGEGAGYAGGIMSAALDGIRIADTIVASLKH